MKLSSTGEARVAGQSTCKAFKGVIPLDSIQYVQMEKRCFGKTVMVMGSAAVLTGLALQASDRNQAAGLSARVGAGRMADHKVRFCQIDT